MALVSAIAIALLFMLLHTPFARRQALSFASAFLAESSELHLQVNELDYNLLTLDFHFSDLSLARLHDQSAPFLTARRLHVDLPWSAIRGSLVLTLIEADQLAISLVQSEGGDWNLPASPNRGEGTRQEPFRLPLMDQVVLNSLALSVQSAGYEVQAVDVDVQLAVTDHSSETLAGSLRAKRPVAVRWGDEGTSVAAFDAEISLDGQDLELGSLEAEMPEGRLSVNGRVVSLIDEPALELTYRGDVLLNRAADWWRPDHQVEGTATARGTIRGPVSAPEITATVEAAGLRWADLSDLALQANFRLESEAVVLDAVTASYRDGRVELSGRVARSDSEQPSRLETTWRDIDSLDLLRHLRLELPFEPAGIVSGTGRLAWTAWQPETIQAEGEITSRPVLDAPSAVPVSGTIRLETNAGRWTAELDNLTVPGLSASGQAEGHLPGAAQPLTDTTLQGAATIVASDLARAVRTLGISRLTSHGTTPGLSGRGTVQLMLSGSFGEPSFNGNVADAQLSYRGIEEIDLRSTFSGSSAGIELDRLLATIGPNEVSGGLNFDFDDDTVRGALAATFPDLSRFAVALPATFAPTGRLDATINVAGTPGSPTVEVDAIGRGMTVGGRPVDQVTVRVALEQGVLTIDEAEARVGDGTADLHGSYALSDRTFELDLVTRGLELASLGGPSTEESSLNGKVRLDVSSSGSLAAPNATGTVRIDRLEWASRPLDFAEARFTITEGIADVDVEVPALNATAGGTIGLVGDDTSFDLRANLDRAELAPLVAPAARDAPFEVSGVVSLQLSATGDRRSLADAKVTAHVRELDTLLGPTPLRLVSPGALEYALGSITTDRLEFRLDDTRVELAGSLGTDSSDRLTATLVGDLSDVEALAVLSGATPETLDLEGALNVDLVITGPIREPVLSSQISIREGSAEFGDLPPATDINVDISSDMQSIRLERFLATWEGARLNGDGELPLSLLHERLPEWFGRAAAGTSTAHLTLTAEEITADVLAPFVEPDSLTDLDARASARLDIEVDDLNLDAIRAKLIFGQLDLAFTGVPLNQRRQTQLELTDGRLHIRALDLGNETDYFTVGGTVDLAEEPTADLTVTAELDLRTVSAFTTAATTEGDALFIANLQGPLADPQINGTLEVTRAGLRVPDPQLMVSGLNGALFLTGNRIVLHELVGEANGGLLEIRGELELVGLQPQGDIQLVGRGIAMELPEGVRTEVDTELDLTLSAEAVSLGGTVTVLRGAYRETLTLAGGFLAALQQQESVTVIGIEEESPLDALNLSFRIVTAEDIIVDNNYADATVGFDLRVGGTVGTPAVTGRAALAEGGQVRLGSRLYEIDTGTIDFVDPAGIEPELDIIARTRVSGRDIRVSITGVPETLTAEFQSDPPESESDIVALLLTGRTLEEAGTAPQAAAAEQALGLASTELLGTAGRSVGLDTLRVEQQVDAGQIRLDSTLVASETDPSTRLTVGKNLSDQVQLIASQDLIESGQLTWILEYLPRRNIELRFVLDDVNDKSYEFRHALSLGSQHRPTAATVRPPAPRVSAIEFSGNLGFSERELADRLRLTVGDRFDFYRWQQDRDELERFYAARGYLEARVRPQRREQGDGTILLTFEISRGPLTILTIEGRELPGEALTRMRETWSQTVFDTFLLEELQTLAREYLVNDGFLQARIEAEVIATSGTDGLQKEIVLRIDQGQRTDQRRIDFRGNEQLTTQELESFIRRSGLVEVAWSDPEPLIRAMRSFYQSEGMLEAEVTVASPEFEGDVGRLPVAIGEGPVFTVSGISFEGAEARSVELVQGLVRLQTADVYSISNLSDARARVDQSYRQAGFNQARVTVRSTVDRAANTVAVAFEINEGPQQVIEEIEVVGGDRTHVGLISRALQISPGQVVDMSAWNRSRQRLYETGAFRSVDIEAEPIAPRPEEAEAGQQPVRARVVLEEWPLYRLRYGVQLKDEEAPFGDQTDQTFRPGIVGDLTRHNFAGRAVTLGTAFRWDADYRVVRGFARVPTFFGLPITSSVFVSQEQTTLGEQNSLTVADLSRLTLEQRLRPRPTMTVAYGYSFDRNDTFDADPDPGDLFGGSDEIVNVARLTAGVVMDTRNDLFDASRGWFHSSTFEYAPEALGSELRFAKYTTQQFHYRSVGRGVVLASAVRLGVAAGFGQDLILSERFFAGGGNTVRGYRQDALGPLFLGLPDGGNSSVVLNQEVRFPIFGPVRGVGFLDAGNVFALAEDFTLGDLRVGAGLGLRFNTPFGLFRVDLATPLSDVPDYLKSHFFFSIGQVF